MILHINFDNTSYYGEDNQKLRKTIIYEATEKTKIRDLMLFLGDFVDYHEDLSIDSNIIGHFSFVNGKDLRKGKLDFNLIDFLKNFNYNIENIVMHYDEAFGIGAYVDFEDIARIQINANEPEHFNAHVHIARIGKHNVYYRIDLESLTQMKNEKDWKKEFSNKERKTILEFLGNNREKLTEYYNRCRKGEYITEEYILVYNGKKYIINKQRTY